MIWMPLLGIISCGYFENDSKPPEQAIQRWKESTLQRAEQSRTLSDVWLLYCVGEGEWYLNPQEKEQCAATSNIFEQFKDLKERPRENTKTLQQLHKLTLEHKKFVSVIPQIKADMLERGFEMTINLPYSGDAIAKVKEVLHNHDKYKESIDNFLETNTTSDLSFEIQKPYTKKHVEIIDASKDILSVVPILREKISTLSLSEDLPTAFVISVDNSSIEPIVLIDSVQKFQKEWTDVYWKWRNQEECLWLENYAKSRKISWGQETSLLCMGGVEEEEEEEKSPNPILDWESLPTDMQRGFLLTKAKQIQNIEKEPHSNRDFFYGVLLYYYHTSDKVIPREITQILWLVFQNIFEQDTYPALFQMGLHREIWEHIWNDSDSPFRMSVFEWLRHCNLPFYEKIRLLQALSSKILTSEQRCEAGKSYAENGQFSMTKQIFLDIDVKQSNVGLASCVLEAKIPKSFVGQILSQYLQNTNDTVFIAEIGSAYTRWEASSQSKGLATVEKAIFLEQEEGSNLTQVLGIGEHIVHVTMNTQQKQQLLFKYERLLAQTPTKGIDVQFVLSSIPNLPVTPTTDSVVKMLFEKSIEVANSISDDSYFYDNNHNRIHAKSRALSTIAKELSKSGLFEKSLEVANSISDEEYKSKSLSTIVEELSKSGLSKEELVPLFEKSLEVANSIRYDSYKSSALSTIVEELSKSGLFEKSLEVANSISDEGNKSSALSTIAVELSKSGLSTEELVPLLGKSLEVANSISDDSYFYDNNSNRVYAKSKSLSIIVEELSKSGMFEKSLEVANSIYPDYRKSEVLSTIAKELSKSGFTERSKEVFEKSLEVAKSIYYDSDKSEALSTIVEELSKSGLSKEELVPLFEKSLEVANSISYYGYKSLSTIAVELSKSGFTERSKDIFEKSIKVAKSIRDEEYKSKSLSAIAKELSKSGFKERSKDVFEKSIKVANSIRYDSDKSSALSAIAKELSKSGLSKEELVPLFEKSIKVANSIRDSYYKSSALSAIEEELSKSDLDKEQMFSLSKEGLKFKIPESKQPLSKIDPITQLLRLHFGQRPLKLWFKNPIQTHSPKTPLPEIDWTSEDVFVIDISHIQIAPQKWILDDSGQNKSSTIPLELRKNGNTLGFIAERYTPRCIRDGIELGISSQMVKNYEQFLLSWERDDKLRQRYRDLFGVPEKNIPMWYGTKMSVISDKPDSCLRVPQFPILSEENYKKRLQEVEQLESEVQKIQELKKRATVIGFDTSDWTVPYQIEKWTKEIETIEGREDRAKKQIKMAKERYIDLSKSLYNDTPVLQRPYNEASLNYLEGEFQRIDGFFEEWKEIRNLAKKVGYTFPFVLPIEKMTIEVLDYHKNHVRNTNETRRIMSKMQFQQVRPGRYSITGLDMPTTVDCPYFIATTEVTAELYQSVLLKKPNSPPNYAISFESKEELDVFFDILSRQMGRTPCEKISDERCLSTGYRIPTIDEWRYAAAARQKYLFSGSNISDEVSWNSLNSDKIMPPKGKKPNAFGLYDMSGNVAESISVVKDDETFYTCTAGGSAKSDPSYSAIFRYNCESVGGVRILYATTCQQRIQRHEILLKKIEERERLERERVEKERVEKEQREKERIERERLERERVEKNNEKRKYSRPKKY